MSSATIFRFLQERGCQRVAGFRGGTADYRADALARLKQTHQLQGPDGIPHGIAAHAQHPDQCAFWGKQVARLHLFGNAPLQLPGNFLIDLVSGDRFEADLRGDSVPSI
jgi:hypothetical protein